MLVLQTLAGCCRVSIKGEDSSENLRETEVSREEGLIDLGQATGPLGDLMKAQSRTGHSGSIERLLSVRTGTTARLTQQNDSKCFAKHRKRNGKCQGEAGHIFKLPGNLNA